MRRHGEDRRPTSSTRAGWRAIGGATSCLSSAGLGQQLGRRHCVSSGAKGPSMAPTAGTGGHGNKYPEEIAGYRRPAASYFRGASGAQLRAGAQERWNRRLALLFDSTAIATWSRGVVTLRASHLGLKKRDTGSQKQPRPTLLAERLFCPHACLDGIGARLNDPPKPKQNRRRTWEGEEAVPTTQAPAQSGIETVSSQQISIEFEARRCIHSRFGSLRSTRRMCRVLGFIPRPTRSRLSWRWRTTVPRGQFVIGALMEDRTRNHQR
jgi:hypothetical protein